MAITETPTWTPSCNTMGNIENSAILTAAILSQTERRAERRFALRDINTLFNKFRQESKKPDEDSLQNFF